MPEVFVQSLTCTSSEEGSPKRANKWTSEEDLALRKAVKQYGASNWKDISRVVGTRNDLQCFHRWQKVLKPGLTKGPWTEEEDRIIVSMIDAGEMKWASIAKKIPGRLGKQIRERYFNHLDPTIKKTPWTKEEDEKLREAQKEYGNKWAKIATLIPGRPENMVKNRWNVLNYPRKRSKPNKTRKASPNKRRKETRVEKSPKIEEMRKAESEAGGELEIEQEKSIMAAAQLLLSLHDFK